MDTGDARPVKVRLRRLPLAHQEAAYRELEEMLQSGIVEQQPMGLRSGDGP